MENVVLKYISKLAVGAVGIETRLRQRSNAPKQGVEWKEVAESWL